MASSSHILTRGRRLSHKPRRSPLPAGTPGFHHVRDGEVFASPARRPAATTTAASPVT